MSNEQNSADGPTSPQIERLLKLVKAGEKVESSQQNPFVFYALAIEYRNEGDLERARHYFEFVHENFPEYLPNFYHYGICLESQGNAEGAAKILDEGIQLAKVQNDMHALSELEGARQNL